MKRLRRRITGTLAMIATGLLAHALLLHWLAERNVVAVLLSAGAHSPPSALLAAGAFLVIRVLVVLVLPGALLCRMTLWFVDWWKERNRVG